MLALGLPAARTWSLTTRPDQRALAVGAGGDRRAPRPALVIGAYGDVQWVRNLRAAGEGEILVGGRTETVSARELDRTEATDFYARVLPAMVSRSPWFGRLFARVLFTAPPLRFAMIRSVRRPHDPSSSSGSKGVD